MAKITLSTIRDAVEAKYGSFEIELDENNTVVLLHPVRLSPEQRKALSESAKVDEVEGEDEEGDVAERLLSVVRAVAATPTAYDKLIEACSPNGFVDLGILSEVIKDYMESQKVGEASASQD